MDERYIQEIYELAEKMSEGQKLTETERALYDDVLEDGDAYRAFCLCTTFIDMPLMYMDSSRQRIERLSRAKENIARYGAELTDVNEAQALKETEKKTEKETMMEMDRYQNFLK